MDPTHNLYRALDAEWAAVGDSPPARAAMARWARDEPLLAGFSTPGDVVRYCRRRHDAAGADRLLGALVRHAADPLAARTVLQAVLPGLAAQVRRRARQGSELHGAGSPWEALEDLDGEAIAIALGRIATLAGTAPERAPQAIVDAAWAGLRAGAARRERRARVAVLALDEIPELIAPPARTVAEELAVAIVGAVKERRLARHDAAVVYTSRVLGGSLADVAAAQGRDVRAVRLQRARAERTLARGG